MSQIIIMELFRQVDPLVLAGAAATRYFAESFNENGILLFGPCNINVNCCNLSWAKNNR